MGRVLGHPLPLVWRGVAGADRGANFGEVGSRLTSQRRYLLQRSGQILVDVVGEGLQGRDVYHLGLVGKAAGEPVPDQGIDTGQERGKRLAGAGWGGDEGVASAGDGRPPGFLRRSWGVEPAIEPLLDDGVELGQGHGPILAYGAAPIPPPASPKQGVEKRKSGAKDLLIFLRGVQVPKDLGGHLGAQGPVLMEADEGLNTLGFLVYGK